MQSPERNQAVDTISCVPFASKYRHSRRTGQTEKFPEAPCSSTAESGMSCEIAHRYPGARASWAAAATGTPKSKTKAMSITLSQAAGMIRVPVSL